MMKNRAFRAVLILLVLAALGGGAWYFLLRPSAADSATLTASGTVETTTISIAPQLGGKVASVNVKEGDSVKAGQVLFTLDDSLLQAQRKVAAANVEQAQASSQAAQVTAQEALDNLLRSDTPQAQAQLALANAQKALTDATTNYNNVVLDPKKGAYLDAQDWAYKAKVRLDYVLRHHDAGWQGYFQVQAAWTEYSHALQAEQKAYNDYIHTGYSGVAASRSTQDIVSGQYAVAKAAVDDAEYNLSRVANGPNPEDVTAAQARVDAAKATLAQAQANLGLIDAQIAELTVKAPEDSIVLARSVEPGETVNPGGVALELGRLSTLTITVYVPEDRVGEISLGQGAEMGVDSYPGEKFSATVSYISDQAEFTPRNVETVAGRQSTVFAVKLRLSDTSGKLKPGMPGDVTFDR
jgi:multidrug resistance efflux pump